MRTSALTWLGAEIRTGAASAPPDRSEKNAQAVTSTRRAVDGPADGGPSHPSRA